MEDGPVAVIGGAGRIGRRVVQLLVDQSVPVRVLTQDVERARRTVAAEVEFAKADVRDASTLAAPLRECAAVVFSVEPGSAGSGANSPKATMFDGVAHVIAAATAGGARPHVVLISQIYVTRTEHSMNAHGGLLDWRSAGENLVRDSGLPYTIVRPSWLMDRSTAGAAVRLEQGDRGEGQISRDDVALACVQALSCPQANGTTFEMFNQPGTAPIDWAELFGRLVPDAKLPV